MLFTSYCCVNVGQRDLCGSIRHGAGSETPESYLQDFCGQEDRVCCQLQHLLSTGCNSMTEAVGGPGTSNRACPEALRAGKCRSSYPVFSWRRAGALWAVVWVLPLVRWDLPQCRALPVHLWGLVRAHSAVLGNMPRESLCRGWKNVTIYGAEFEERIENKRHNLSVFLPLQLFTCATDAWYGPPCSLGRYLEVVSGALALQKPFTNSVCSCFGWGVNSVLTWVKHSICFPS